MPETLSQSQKENALTQFKTMLDAGEISEATKQVDRKSRLLGLKGKAIGTGEQQ